MLTLTKTGLSFRGKFRGIQAYRHNNLWIPSFRGSLILKWDSIRRVGGMCVYLDEDRVVLQGEVQHLHESAQRVACCISVLF